MTVTTNMLTFASSVLGTPPTPCVSRQPRCPSPTKSILSPTPSPPTIWKIMHHPEWMPNPEEEDMIRSQEYWMYPNPSTPLSAIQSIELGDEIYMQIKTMIGKTGRRLSRETNKNYLRRGKVIMAPHERSNPCDTKDGWRCMKIDWTDEIIPKENCIYKNAPLKTITRQN